RPVPGAFRAQEHVLAYRRSGAEPRRRGANGPITVVNRWKSWRAAAPSAPVHPGDAHSAHPRLPARGHHPVQLTAVVHDVELAAGVLAEAGDRADGEAAAGGEGGGAVLQPRDDAVAVREALDDGHAVVA